MENINLNEIINELGISKEGIIVDYNHNYKVEININNIRLIIINSNTTNVNKDRRFSIYEFDNNIKKTCISNMLFSEVLYYLDNFKKE